MKSVRMLVIGSVNMDLVLEMDRAPEAGETVMGKTYRYVPGGKGANQAVAAQRQGAQVSFAGRIGRDANGDILRQGLEKEGMDVSCLQVDASAPTGLAVIPVEANGENRIVVMAGANNCVSPQDVEAALEDDWDCVMLQFEIPEETVVAACKKAVARGIPVVVDAGPARAFPLQAIAGIDILSPNEKEAEALVGFPVEDDASAKRACQVLMERVHARYIVLKLGGRGAMLYDGTACTLFPAMPGIRPVDTTAAGDSFTAAMAVAWIEKQDISTAMVYGNGAGGLAVTRRGAQPSIPTREEVQTLVHSVL